MTLPSAVVPQKKEMEPPNQNASQMARIHININILGGMPANRRERRAPQSKGWRSGPEAFRAGRFLRLDENRKPRMKSLWHPGYDTPGVVDMFLISPLLS